MSYKNPTNQAQQKLFNALDEFVDSADFQRTIKDLRQKFDIPSDGFSLPQELKEKINNSRLVDNVFAIPKEMQKRGLPYLKEINIAMRKECSKFPFNDMNFLFFFNAYLFYNNKFFEPLKNAIGEVNICKTINIYDEIRELQCFYPSDDSLLGLKNKYKSYPVAIFLHPSISQRDLVGYIKDNWPFIQYNLNRYKKVSGEIGRAKKKNLIVKERNNFIYQNRHLPRKEIMRLITDKFDIGRMVDYAYIGKIISAEKKRRKEV